jgi:hypothetical protein
MQDVKEEKEVGRDLKISADNQKVAVFFFDMGSIFQLPKGNACMMSQKSKWQTFSLTARTEIMRHIILCGTSVASQRAEHIAQAL